jgi:hypothetical protein
MVRDPRNVLVVQDHADRHCTCLAHDRFDTPTDLSDEAVAEISRDLRQLLGTTPS